MRKFLSAVTLAVLLTTFFAPSAEAQNCVIGQYANLRGCDFSNTDLRGASLGEADFSFANLSGANLSRADMGGVDLTGADLTNAQLVNTFLGDADFIDTIIEGADFTGAFLGDARYSVFHSSGLIGLPAALPPDWQVVDGYFVGPGEPLPEKRIVNGYIIEPNSDLVDATLSGENLRGINCSYCDFTNADLSNSDLTNAVLVGANLSGADLTYAILDGADLSSTNVEGASLSEAQLGSVRGSDIKGIPSSLPDGWSLEGGELVMPIECFEYSQFPFDGFARVDSHLALAGTEFECFDGNGEFIDWVYNSYQWILDGSTLVAESAAEIDLKPEFVGKNLILEVTISKPGWGIGKHFLQAGEVEPASLKVASRPTISGSFLVGETVKANPGNWDSGVTHNFQWLRDGAPITGQNSSTYSITASDLGKTLSVQNSGKKTGYNTVTKTSTGSKVDPGTIKVNSTPTILGSVKVGQTVTANPGNWDNGVTHNFQWLRDGAPITGQNSSTYSITASDLGKTLSVQNSGKKTGYNTVTKTSSGSKVDPGTIKVNSTPTILGSVKVGQIITANPGNWDNGVTLRYQWIREGVSLQGETSNKYTITPGDLGRPLRLMLVADKLGYETLSLFSDKVTPSEGALATKVPVISGATKVGSTLKCSTTLWTKSAKVQYQWLANGIAIKGATSSSLKLTSALKGKKISVKVTQSATGYMTASKTSSTVSVK